MYQLVKKEKMIADRGNAMETGDHLKNGASPKSQMNRGNIMQRTFLLLFVFFVNAVTAFAQDIITLKNGEDIQALVQEIGENDVKYKKFENQNGPVYSMKKSEILMIRYANGSKDVFAADTAPSTSATTTAIKDEVSTQPQQPYPSQYNTQPRYGSQQRYGNIQPNPNYHPKSPGLSWFLSSLVPGIGQFYNGDVGKGIAFMGVYVGGYTLMMVAGLQNVSSTDYYDASNIDNTNVGLLITGSVLVFGSWIWSQIDAPHSAKKKNHANGYFSWNLDKSGKTYLALEPDVKLTPVSVSQNIVHTPTYGLSLKVHF